MREWRYSSLILDLGTRWRCVVRFTSLAALPPTEGALDAQWLEGWVGLRADPDTVEKRQILHCRKSNPDRPARNPSLYRLSYPDSPK
jgi:hypothetical protein